MVRVVLPSLLAAGLAVAGVLVGWGADRYAATALVLHAEPVLLVLAVWGIALLRWLGRPGLSIGLAVGTVAAVAGIRLPLPVGPPGGAPPPWIGPVSRCASALKVPADPVRLLQWTVDDTVAPSTVRAVVAASKANVVVLHGVGSTALAEAALDVTGGESKVFGAEGGAVAVAAAGGFHPCGDTLEWSDGLDTPDGYLLTFVGVPPSTIFPLLVARFPAPVRGDWSERMGAATDRVYDAVGGLQGASAVVVADAPAPRTYRMLDGRMAALGLGSVPLPPSWPARLGPVPLLTLHPYGRAWAGPIWRVTGTSRVLSPQGTHAPVLAVLEGPARPEVDAPVEAPRRRLDEPTIEPAPEE